MGAGPSRTELARLDALGIDEDGIHVWVRPGPLPARPGPRAGLFLDRDGVVVEEVGYLSRPADVRLIPGAAEVVAAANAAGILVVVVTNQSGIGRGLYGWADFAAVEARIAEELGARGARLDAVFACPHHPAGQSRGQANHPARKPNPGMLLRALDLLAISPAGSWIVGDRASDILAGCNAGLAGGLHVATGWGREPGEREAALAAAVSGRYCVLAADSLAAAPSLLPLFRPSAA